MGENLRKHTKTLFHKLETQEADGEQDIYDEKAWQAKHDWVVQPSGFYKCSPEQKDFAPLSQLMLSLGMGPVGKPWRRQAEASNG